MIDVVLASKRLKYFTDKFRLVIRQWSRRLPVICHCQSGNMVPYSTCRARCQQQTRVWKSCWTTDL